MKVAIYARVSTTDQKCEMQLNELRQYIQARKWILIEEYIDEGFSGKNANRPAIKKCMTDARTRKFDCILVWKIDRWGRTLGQLVNDVTEFDSMGLRFISITQGIDTDKTNPASRLLLNLMGSFAQFERENTLERIAAGIKNAKEKGTRSGKAIGRPKAVFSRDRAIELWQEGKTVSQVAQALGIPRGTAYKALQGVSKPSPTLMSFNGSEQAA